MRSWNACSRGSQCTPAVSGSAPRALRSRSWRAAALHTNKSPIRPTSHLNEARCSLSPCLPGPPARQSSLARVPSHASSFRPRDSSFRSHAISSGSQPDPLDIYDLQATKAMVETAMLAAVSGLGYILATTVKLENSIGYFLPLPIIIASMRSGKKAGLDTALATLCLLLVVVGPLKAVAYFLLHGIVASTLGALWHARVGWAVSVPLGALARMVGQAAYLALTCFTMNENMLMAVLANVHSFLDQMSASMGMSGAPSPMTVGSILFAMILVNSLCYVFLIHVIYRMALQSMGFQLGPLPGLVHKYLYGGTVTPDAPPSNYQRSISATS